MIKPKEHINEAARLASLYSYNLLDTIPEQDLDDLTALAAEICGTHIALISLVDQNRQWFKSNKGLNATETPREVAFCAHEINESSELLIVEDANKDERFSDNPLVTEKPFVTFYAGVTLKSESNLPIGTIHCSPSILPLNEYSAPSASRNKRTLAFLALAPSNLISH